MDRKSFFRNLILGAVAIYKSPEILAEVSKSVPVVEESTNGILSYISTSNFEYGQYRLAEAQLMRSFERAFLFGGDSIHWTEEEIRTLKKTVKQPYKLQGVRDVGR